MRPGGGGRGELLLVACARLYGALLVLYPKAFRRRYAAQMRRDFRELMWEGLEEGGATELVRVCAQAFSDLVLTALMERSPMLARLAYYLSVDARIVAGAMVVAVVLVAVAVTWASSTRTPTYEASAQVWVDQEQGDQSTNFSGSGEEVQTLSPDTVEGFQTIILTMVHAIDSPPIAKETIQHLGLRMKPAELLDNLTVEQVESTSFIVLTYEGTNPQKAQQIVNTVGKVSSELISDRSAAGSRLTATLYEPAVVPDSPVRPDPLRNGLLTLVIGGVLCGGFLLPLSGVAVSVADQLGGQAVRPIGEAGAPAVPPVDPSEAERIKEKELLEALRRCGKLSALGAALETSLSVEEAERMLKALAAKGHLKVTVEGGTLVYALWERDAPL